MYLNLYFIPRRLKNSAIICSALVGGVFKKGLFSGCAILVFLELAAALSLTSFLRKEDDVFSFSATLLISPLLLLFFPCLTCNPFNAKL